MAALLLFQCARVSTSLQRVSDSCQAGSTSDWNLKLLLQHGVAASGRTSRCLITAVLTNRHHWCVQHTDTVSVCFAVVPEGFYVKGPGQVAPCPLGEYKQGFAAAPSCTKCAKGVSTSAVGSSSEVSCTVIQPGFYPATMQGSIVKSTLQCPQSYYCPGGQASAAFNPAAPNVAGTTVVQCPNGLWTEALGATSAVQCSECLAG